ncbi:SPOR domain-containing protein [Flavitalea flava]
MIKNKMVILSLFLSSHAFAQTDTGTGAGLGAGTAGTGTDSNQVVVVKDARIDLLIHKQMEINEATTRDSRRSMPGFRIQVINSPDRNKVFAVKTKIYQQFPELKPYLMYQAPNYKLKVGNFKTQDEAEDYQKQLSRLFPSGMYVIRDTIEVSAGSSTP